MPWLETHSLCLDFRPAFIVSLFFFSHAAQGIHSGKSSPNHRDYFSFFFSFSCSVFCLFVFFRTQLCQLFIGSITQFHSNERTKSILFPFFSFVFFLLRFGVLSWKPLFFVPPSTEMIPSTSSDKRNPFKKFTKS